MGWTSQRPPTAGSPLRSRRSAPGTEPSAARTLALVTLAALAVGATVAWAVPAGRSARNAACGEGSDSCRPALYQVSELGRCQVVSRTDAIAEDTVTFADDVRGIQGLDLSRSIDKNGVVTWRVQQTDERTGAIAVRTFADRDRADRYVLAVGRAAGRAVVEEADGSGVAALLADLLDGPGTADAPEPSAVIRRTGTDPADPPLPGPGPGHAPVQQTWYEPQHPTRVRTVWELDWDRVRDLRLAGPGGSGRLLMALAQSPTGTPIALELEAAGDLAARLVAPTTGSALAEPLSSRPGAPGVPLGTRPGRLVITLDLTSPGARDLAAALTAEVAAPLFQDTSAPPADEATTAADDEPRARVLRAETARRQDDYASPVGMLRALDRTVAGTSVTIHTFRMPTEHRRPDVVLTPGGHLSFEGALPSADYYLAARDVGFVKWQECRQ